ncbi:MAG TPA: CBS domain-containing protein [Candidatus Binatia bacterium]|jgi:CBS domain-containing protein|nr:CBS domain-containing protein [Candidatus Binatia bacterium]
MMAKDIMTKEIITVDRSTSVKGLAKVLTQQQISGAPVIDKKGQMVGVVSEGDIVAKRGKQVKDIMTKKVIAINEETPLEEIASLMATHKIKRLPVMRGKELVGIVSRADIVGAIASGKHIALHTPIYDF